MKNVASDAVKTATSNTRVLPIEFIGRMINLSACANLSWIMASLKDPKSAVVTRPKAFDATAIKRATPPVLLTLDRRSTIPMFRQIYVAARQAILSGKLAAGSRLPPSRMFADELGVARMTVVLAYEHLEAEGYVKGRGSAGTFVSDLRLPPQPPPAKRTIVTASKPLPEISNRSAAFRIGEPALDAFPSALWKRLYARHARRSLHSYLGYGSAAGYLPLQRAIADYITVSRSLRATADQVILVRGARQAMDMVARVLLRPGDRVWMEDPGYLDARHLVEMAGAIPVPVPVDRQGMVVATGIRDAPAARMACVAPSHHFPLGHTLSLPRRLALIEWASRARAWVVEDDFDSEFRYSGAPLASLQGLDTSGRVIYIGTFSKTVCPSLRLGYLIPPPELVDRFRAYQDVVDHLSPTVEQATLTDFIEEGHFTRHIRRMRELYRERRQALLTAAARQLDGLLKVEACDTGMHVLGWLQDIALDDTRIADAASQLGIETRPLSRYCMRVTPPPALVLGFASVPPRELQSGIRGLRKVLTAHST